MESNLFVTKNWNSVPEFHWNNFFRKIWNHLKGGISGNMLKKWNFGLFLEYS